MQPAQSSGPDLCSPIAITPFFHVPIATSYRRMLELKSINFLTTLARSCLIPTLFKDLTFYVSILISLPIIFLSLGIPFYLLIQIIVLSSIVKGDRSLSWAPLKSRHIHILILPFSIIHVTWMFTLREMSVYST